jgi:hypothetical protein
MEMSFSLAFFNLLLADPGEREPALAGSRGDLRKRTFAIAVRALPYEIA